MAATAAGRSTAGVDRAGWELGAAQDGFDRREADKPDVDGMVMSCVFAQNRLGVAIYDAERGVLSVAEAAEHEKDLPVAPVLQVRRQQRLLPTALPASLQAVLS